MLTEFEKQIVTALRSLGEGLSRGKVEFALDARAGAQTSLQAVISFVQSVEDFDEQQLTLPLTALLAGLNSLERGAASPIVKSRKRAGRPADTGFPDTIKACAVFSVDVLNERGMPLSKAYNIVSREFEKLRFPIKGKRGSTSATTLRGWREGLSRKPEHNQMLHTWRSLDPYRAHFRKLSTEQAWKQLRPMLAQLIDGLRPTLN